MIIVSKKPIKAFFIRVFDKIGVNLISEQAVKLVFFCNYHNLFWHKRDFLREYSRLLFIKGFPLPILICSIQYWNFVPEKREKKGKKGQNNS
jgi:hypothetical protein